MKATKQNVKKLINNEIVKLDGYDTVSKNRARDIIKIIMNQYDNVYCSIEKRPLGYEHLVVTSNTKTHTVFLDVNLR